jgi:hypothetical protein
MHGSRDQDHQTDVDTRTAYFKSRRGDFGWTEEGIAGGGVIVGLGGV